MTKHAFLSEEWIEAARAIHAEQAAGAEPPSVSVRMNLVVEGVPFGGGQLDAHVDTSSGIVDVELGHLDAPDVKVNLDYETAKAVSRGRRRPGGDAGVHGRQGPRRG